jgi:hypothetical protein
MNASEQCQRHKKGMESGYHDCFMVQFISLVRYSILIEPFLRFAQWKYNLKIASFLSQRPLPAARSHHCFHPVEHSITRSHGQQKKSPARNGKREGANLSRSTVLSTTVYVIFSIGNCPALGYHVGAA